MKTKFIASIVSCILITYLLTNYFAGNKADKIESNYQMQIQQLNQKYDQKLMDIKLEKQQAYDSLLMIANQRKFTIDELKNKTNEDNKKIRVVVRDYKPDDLDSIIISMFSDISRFN